MTQEDKELLIKDLCARIPYGVKFYFDGVRHIIIGVYKGLDSYVEVANGMRYHIESIKPYLFPMSSMTEEQKREYNKWKHDIPVCRYEYGDVIEEIELYDSLESFEYLIENHFDYRGLIEKGLAIDATDKNIY